MSENQYRCILGAVILTILFFGSEFHMYIICGYLTLEFLFNISVVSISNFAMGRGNIRAGGLLEFGSERVLTLTFTLILVVTTYFNNDYTWSIPWFVALMLFAAGITKICPMKMGFAYLGLK